MARILMFVLPEDTIMITSVFQKIASNQLMKEIIFRCQQFGGICEAPKKFIYKKKYNIAPSHSRIRRSGQERTSELENLTIREICRILRTEFKIP